MERLYNVLSSWLRASLCQSKVALDKSLIDTLRHNRLAKIIRVSLTLLTVMLLMCIPCVAAADALRVPTQHNDNYRTGANLNETILSPSTVNGTSFGKLFTLSVDGAVYAQPLYQGGLYFPATGQTHNVVFVATMHNGVYAFDADTGQTLWYSWLGLSCPSDGIYCTISPEVGILSTPVIDIGTNTIYVVTKNSNPISYWLHALDTRTGSEKFNGPDHILGGFAYLVNQRPALLLSDNVVYIAFGLQEGDMPHD